MRSAYIDLDGTLLGKGGVLVHDHEGHFSLRGVRALEACDRAGVEVVLMSGRRRAQVAEDARLIGARSFIFEAGSGLCLDGEDHFLTGDFQPGAQTIHQQIASIGAPELLLEHYAGRLEYHTPWHTGRDISHLLRGLVDLDEAHQLLAQHGLGSLKLVDNGTVRRRSEALAALPTVRAYHLIPAPASKAAAVAKHMQARGYQAADCIAIGDSREDLRTAQSVGQLWLVENALRHDPSLQAELGEYPNVTIASNPNGAGVYEAIVTTLMGDE